MQEPWTCGCPPLSVKGHAAWEFIEKSQVVSRVPCELVGMFVTCGGQACTVNVYDGPNAQSPQVADLDAQASRTMPFLPVEPILCRRGLYLVLDGNVTSVTVQWRPLPAGWRP